jgi:lysophospholipase L1-like esterase
LARQIIESTVSPGASGFTLAGSGWAPTSNALASGGAYHSTSHAGDTCTITVAAGIIGVLLLCVRLAEGNAATVTVDGVAQANWSQRSFTTNASATWSNAGATPPVPWWQSAYQPIFFANTGIAHTIVLGIASGTITIDAMETYTAESVVAGRVTAFGNSIVAGATLGSPSVQRFGALVAAALGSGYSEDNHGISGEILAFQSSTNVGFGWQRAAMGSQGGTGASATATVSGGALTGFTGLVGGSGWSPSQPPYVAIGPGSTGVFSAAAHAVVTGTAVTSLPVDAGGTLYTVAPTVTIGNTWWPQTPELALLMPTLNDLNFYGTADPGGGLGYVLESVKQRLREMIWRMQLNSPGTLVVYGSLTYQPAAAGANEALKLVWNAALSGVLAEPGMSLGGTPPVGIDCYWPLANGGGAGVINGTDFTHPTAAGHKLLAAEILTAIGRARSRPGVRMTGSF